MALIIHFVGQYVKCNVAPSFGRSCLFKGLRRARATVRPIWRIKGISMMCKSRAWPPAGTRRFAGNRAGDRSGHVGTNRSSGNMIIIPLSFLKVKIFVVSFLVGAV
jgi:hypothetical protein